MLNSIHGQSNCDITDGIRRPEKVLEIRFQKKRDLEGSTLKTAL